MHYFKVTLSDRAGGLWFLGDPSTAAGEVVDPRIFTVGERYDGPEPLSVPRPPGVPAPFLLGTFMYPVVGVALRDRLRQLDGQVQLIPLRVDSRGVVEEFAILNALRLVDAIDEGDSIFERHTRSSSRPDRAGEYKVIYRLKLRREQIPSDAHVFRLAKYPIPLLVSEDVKTLAESLGSSNSVMFRPVT